MPQSILEEVKNNKLAVLSICGSVASLIALSIVLLDKTANILGMHPEWAIWRIIFIVIALFASGGVVLFTYQWICDAVFSTSLLMHQKTIAVIFRFIIGSLAFGVCLDALISAFYWTIWMWGPIQLVKQLFSVLF